MCVLGLLGAVEEKIDNEIFSVLLMYVPVCKHSLVFAYMYLAFRFSQIQCCEYVYKEWGSFCLPLLLLSRKGRQFTGTYTWDLEHSVEHVHL